MKARKKKYCKRCGNQVVRETVHLEDGYPWYCPCCDQNMFNFEVFKSKKKIKSKKLVIQN